MGLEHKEKALELLNHFRKKNWFYERPFEERKDLAIKLCIKAYNEQGFDKEGLGMFWLQTRRELEKLAYCS